MNKKITDLDLIDSVDNLDLFEVVDVSDTTQSPEGSSKKASYSQLTKRRQYVTWVLKGNTSATNDWLKYGNANKSAYDNHALIPDASLTDSNNFANYGSQTPCFVAMFNCKVTNVSIRGFSNSSATTQIVDLAIIGSGVNPPTASTINEPNISARSEFTVKKPGLHHFCFSFPADKLMLGNTIPQCGELRFVINNKNTNINFLTTTLTIELTEVTI